MLLEASGTAIHRIERELIARSADDSTRHPAWTRS
jgi:hypothetical protein